MTVRIVTLYPEGTPINGIDHVRSSVQHEVQEYLEAQTYVALEDSTSLTPVEVRFMEKSVDEETGSVRSWHGLFNKEGATSPYVVFTTTSY